jgi:hypothetical protein
MEKSLKQLANTSFFFLVVIGGLHITSSFLVTQELAGRGAWILMSSLDLPFLFVALLYGSSKLSLQLGSFFGSLKTPALILAILSAISFIFALYFNFALPDATLF